MIVTPLHNANCKLPQPTACIYRVNMISPAKKKLGLANDANKVQMTMNKT